MACTQFLSGQESSRYLSSNLLFSLGSTLKELPQSAKKSADPCLSQGRGGAWDHRMCGTCFSQCFAFSTRHPSHSTLCSQPRSHSRHSTFCHFPRATHATDAAICVYGVPKRNRPRQTVCSSNTSLRQTLPCSSPALLRPRHTFLQLHNNKP